MEEVVKDIDGKKGNALVNGIVVVGLLFHFPTRKQGVFSNP
jgi:hypothetical protein